MEQELRIINLMLYRAWIIFGKFFEIIKKYAEKLCLQKKGCGYELDIKVY